MPVSKTSKGNEPVSERYVADLYGDVEYMCGGAVAKIRNALVRRGADRGSAMRPDIYNGIVSWINPDGTSSSFVSSGGAALVTVRTCVIRRASAAALPWCGIDGYDSRRKQTESETGKDMDLAVYRVRSVLDECKRKDLPYDSDSAAMCPAVMDGAVRLAERAAEAVVGWKSANARSREKWERLAADFPGVCSVCAGPADWAWIADGNDIDAEGENTDPAEQMWAPDEAVPDFVVTLSRWVKRVSGQVGRDIMSEAERAAKEWEREKEAKKSE